MVHWTMNSFVSWHERLTFTCSNLEEKKEQVLASIEEQGKLTEELRAQILAGTDAGGSG